MMMLMMRMLRTWTLYRLTVQGATASTAIPATAA